jgi:drug/metabolite transporter (DMT)-like permease
VQLSVPILAAAGGVFFLGEPLTLRLLVASVAILGGIALVILMGERKDTRGPAPKSDLGIEPRA